MRSTPIRIKVLCLTVAGLCAALALTIVPASAADTSYVGSAYRPQRDGYWLTTATGAVAAAGAAKTFGDMSAAHLNQPIVGIASTASGNGYWLVAGDGGIFSFGDAQFFGSTGSIHLNKPIVGMAATPTGHGYWMVASDGGIFAYGDAQFFGSTGAITLQKPVVAMASTPSGRGYWLAASDGGIFAYGDAHFYGSAGDLHLNQPMVGIASSPSGHGYWMVASDGGIFNYGDSDFVGSISGIDTAKVIAIVPNLDGGYTIVSEHGAVHRLFGKDATTTTSTTVPGGSTTTSTTVAPPGTTTTTVPSGPITNTGVAYTLPSTATLRSSSNLVFAHYFTPFTISRDNKPAASDTYATTWLNPAGENGLYASEGGLLRDRPLPRAPLAGNFRLLDMQTDIRNAIGAGVDGFALNVFGYSTSADQNVNWNLDTTMMTAAEQTDPGFKIMLQPDMSGTPWDSDTLALAMSKLAASPSAYRLSDGRLVITPFEAEKETPAWWATWIDTMKNRYNIDVAFVPCFLSFSPNAAAFASISYGFSNWGARNPAFNAPTSFTNNVNLAHSYGKIWMQPVSTQDERPRSSVFDESNNTETLRDTWAGAINSHADWVLLPTWNDLSEAADIEPTVAHGYSFLDLEAYYLTKYKTGFYPTSTKDAIILTHRNQFANATSTYVESAPMVLRSGSTPARDTVEAFTILKTAGDVTVKVGASTYTYAAPAGVYTRTFPLALGSVSGSVAHGGVTSAAVSSPFTVTATPYVQDLQYYAVSSMR